MAGFVRSVPRPIQVQPPQDLPGDVQVLADFTGGLDLYADGFQVEGNRTFDVMNVDLLPQGGLRMRDTVKPFHPNTFGYTPGALSRFEGTSTWLLASVDRNVWSCPGYENSFHDTGIAGTNPVTTPRWISPYQWRGTQANSYLYLQNGYDKPQRWAPGGAPVTLNQTFNEDLENPTAGNMVIGRYTAVHLGHFWVAYTRESGVEHANRLRWSHPIVNDKGQECFRSTDYVEVDAGADGESITGLIPGGSELWLFKQHSVYQLSGVDTTTFNLDPVSRDVGAAGPEAFAARGDQVWFWDSREGLHTLNMASRGIQYGVSLKNVTGPLVRLFRDRLVDYDNAYLTQVGVVNGKVWVNVPCTDGRRMFVYDPTVGQDGAWTEYDLQVGMFLDWLPLQDEAMPLAVQLDDTRPAVVLRLDIQGDVDDFGGLVTRSVPTHYRTVWASAELPLAMKRWLSLEAVIEGDVPLTIQAYTDWSADIDQSVSFPVPTRMDPLILGESVLVTLPKEKVTPDSDETTVPCLDVTTVPDGFAPVSARPRVRTKRVKLSVPTSRVIQLRVSGPVPSERFTLRGLGLRWQQSTRRST